MEEKNDKVFLVTGACGFIGSHLVEYLVEKGYLVFATDRILIHPLLPKEAPFFCADFLNRRSVDDLWLEVMRWPNFWSEVMYSYDLEKPKKIIIFHLAAIFDFTAPWEKIYEVNVLGTKNLFQSILANPFLARLVERAVVFSSSTVYGKNLLSGPCDESATFLSRNNYERTKAMQEIEAMSFYHNCGIPVTIVRPAPVYGTRSFYGVFKAIELINKGWIRFIIGDGQKRGSFIHVEDVCRAVDFLTQSKESIGEAYNLADDSNYRCEELLFCIASLLEKKILGWPKIPVGLAQMIAFLSEWLAKKLGGRPKFEKDLVTYLTTHFQVDNSKLKNFQVNGEKFYLQHRDILNGIGSVIEWYKEERIL